MSWIKDQIYNYRKLLKTVSAVSKSSTSRVALKKILIEAKRLEKAVDEKLREEGLEK